MAALQAPAVPRPVPKSPPLAFQTTSNDSLWSPMAHGSGASASASAVTSPPISQLFDMHVSNSEMEMQIQIEKQADALRLQNQAFTAERESWQLEKDRLYRRVASLEALLKGTTNGHSPARSPVISPTSGSMCSPPHLRNSTPIGSSRLASIAEVESSSPLSENRRPSPVLKRESAPTHINLPPTAPFDDALANDALKVGSTKDDMFDEVPRSPPQTRAALSPPPPAYLHHAGHTPLRASTSSGQASPARSNLDGHLDTPTRSNTALNEVMTDGSDDDRPLKGPLMLPELPSNPDEENFTMDMLSAKLQDLVEHPEDSEPMVLKTPSPAIEFADLEDTMAKAAATNDTLATQPEGTDCKTASKSTSPTAVRAEDAFDGGIKLRKKPSSNFGAPLGQMNPMWKH